MKQKSKRSYGPCIYKVREVVSPIMEEFRGFRILVAVPNMQGTRPFKGTICASFTRKFLIFQTSDYGPEEIKAKIEQIKKELIGRGFEKVEDVEEYEERMMTRM